jgi:hypothetical protein
MKLNDLAILIRRRIDQVILHVLPLSLLSHTLPTLLSSPLPHPTPSPVTFFIIHLVLRKSQPKIREMIEKKITVMYLTSQSWNVFNSDLIKFICLSFLFTYKCYLTIRLLDNQKSCCCCCCYCYCFVLLQNLLV